MSSSIKSQCALYRTPSARPCCFYLFLPTEPAPAPIPPSLTSGPCPNHRRYAALGNSAAHWLLAAARIGSYEVPAACTSTIADLSRNLGPLASPPLFLPFSQLVTTRASVASSSSLAFLSGLSGRRARDCLTLACLPSAFDLI